MGALRPISSGHGLGLTLVLALLLGAHAETDPDQLVIDIQVAGLPAGQAAQLARRLERLLTVTQVLRSEKRRAAA